MVPPPFQNPLLRDDLPRYPPLIQLIRVTSGKVAGPPGLAQPAGSSLLAPVLHVAFTQQLRTDSMIPRDREPCLADDVRGFGLTPGFYIGRLAGSWTSLPVYEVIESAVIRFGATDPADSHMNPTIPPENPATVQFYYNTTTNALFVWNPVTNTWSSAYYLDVTTNILYVWNVLLGTWVSFGPGGMVAKITAQQNFLYSWVEQTTNSPADLGTFATTSPIFYQDKTGGLTGAYNAFELSYFPNVPIGSLVRLYPWDRTPTYYYFEYNYDVFPGKVKTNLGGGSYTIEPEYYPPDVVSTNPRSVTASELNGNAAVPLTTKVWVHVFRVNRTFSYWFERAPAVGDDCASFTTGSQAFLTSISFNSATCILTYNTKTITVSCGRITSIA